MNQSELSFRKATKDDITDLVKLVNKAYRPDSKAVKGWTHESDFVDGERTNLLQMTELLNQANVTSIVAIQASKIVGCVAIEVREEYAYIGMLTVDPILQGSGAGKTILQFAENYTVEHFGIRQFMMVVVSARTELIDFYIRRGYLRTNEILEYPVHANVGEPKRADLKIEILTKTVS